MIAEAAAASEAADLADEVEAALAKIEILDDYYFIMDVTNADIGD